MMKISYHLLLLCSFIHLAGCQKNGEIIIMGNGLVIEDLVIGEGSEAQDFNKVVVNYTGTLEDGSIFDSSLKPGRTPFTFTLGVGSVIKGWDLGVKGMKVGEVRKLTIPHYMAYGVNEREKIPAKSTLYFEVELVGFISEGELKSETTKQGEGKAIEAGTPGQFHYTGWTDGFNGKQKFDSSRDRNQPFTVALGQGRVIKGWDEGIALLKKG